MTRTNALALLLTMAFVPAVAASTAPESQETPVDVTGTWIFDVQTDTTDGMPKVTFEMKEDNTLAGHYSSENLGEADLTGTVMGDQLRFTFEADLQGFPVEVSYAATIEDDDSMRGTIDIAGLLGGTFTGARQPEEGEEEGAEPAEQ
jgi:hypothetical protein